MDHSRVLEKYQEIIPVPVIKLANALDIEVYETEDLDDHESGAIVRESGDYVIYVNKKHPPERKRFTIAHEIAHFILHKEYVDKVGELVQQNKQPGFEILERNLQKDLTPNKREMEQAANKFAAGLLMPEKKFREVWENSNNIEEIAGIFQVSTTAANIRAKDLFDEFIY